MPAALERGTLRRSPPSSEAVQRHRVADHVAPANLVSMAGPSILNVPKPTPTITKTSVHRKPVACVAGQTLAKPLHPNVLLNAPLPSFRQPNFEKRQTLSEQIEQLQIQAITRKAPDLRDHPAFARTAVSPVECANSSRIVASMPISSLAESVQYQAKVEDDSASSSYGKTSTEIYSCSTPATSATTTPEKPVSLANIRRKPVPIPQSEKYSAFSQSSSLPQQDPIALAASRAAALRIKRKTIPRPISILPPLPSIKSRVGVRGEKSKLVTSTPLTSTSSSYNNPTTPWTAKYGNGRTPSLRTPQTSKSMRAALKGFGTEWKAQLHEPTTAVTSGLTNPAGDGALWTSNPPAAATASEWDTAKEVYSRVKEYRYEKKRTAAIEAARSAKTDFGSTSGNVAILKGTQTRKPTTPASATSRFFSFFRSGTSTPNTPKTPRTPKSAFSLFSSRSRSGSVVSSAPKTPKTPFTPSEATKSLGQFFSSISKKATASAESKAEEEALAEEQQRQKIRAALKANISRPTATGPVFAADAFDPAVVTAKQAAKAEAERARLLKTEQAKPFVLPSTYDARGNKRNTSSKEFILAANGQHPAQQPGYVASAPPKRQHNHKLSFSSQHTAKSSASRPSTSGKESTASKPKSILTNLKLKARRTSVDSDVSFACAGHLGPDGSLHSGNPRCNICGTIVQPEDNLADVPAIMCENCAGGVEGMENALPLRQASLQQPVQAHPEHKLPKAYRSSSIYSARPRAAPTSSSARHERKKTLDPRDSIGIWETDSWLNTSLKSKSSDASKISSAGSRTNAASSSINGSAVSQVSKLTFNGQVPEGRDTGFYRFYDELLVGSPTAGVGAVEEYMRR